MGGGSPAQSALLPDGCVTTLKCGQILDFVSPNQFGGLAYLWSTGTLVGLNNTVGTTLNLFDAMTGQYILSIVNGTSPSLTVDAGGDLIGYYVNSTLGTQITQSTPINDNVGPVLTPQTTTAPTLS